MQAGRSGGRTPLSLSIIRLCWQEYSAHSDEASQVYSFLQWALTQAHCCGRLELQSSEGEWDVPGCLEQVEWASSSYHSSWSTGKHSSTFIQSLLILWVWSLLPQLDRKPWLEVPKWVEATPSQWSHCWILRIGSSFTLRLNICVWRVRFY